MYDWTAPSSNRNTHLCLFLSCRLMHICQSSKSDPTAKHFQKARWRPATVRYLVRFFCPRIRELEFSTWTGEDALRRAEFCASEHLSKMFRHVCICGNPAPVTFNPVQPSKMKYIPNVPVLIIAANRPQYLFRTLTSVLNAIGVQKVRWFSPNSGK